MIDMIAWFSFPDGWEGFARDNWREDDRKMLIGR
jgi:hypothetical protein